MLTQQAVAFGCRARPQSPSKLWALSSGDRLPSHAELAFPSAGDSDEDTERLALLQECLALFNGSHAFHNYTKRKLYRLVAADLSRTTTCSCIHALLRSCSCLRLSSTLMTPV